MDARETAPAPVVLEAELAQMGTERAVGQRWRRALAEAVRDPDLLCDLLGLGPEFREPARRAARLFPLVVPRGYLARIERGNPADPLLRQVLPLDTEAVTRPGFSADPLAEVSARSEPGLLRKYRGRALLVTTGVCAINCRFCFRRHYPYEEVPRGIEAWEPALASLAADPNIEEVILSGGDPLSLTDEWLGRLAERIGMIEHVKRLRVHTRVPIVLPERVTDELLGLLASGRFQPIVVAHVNHAREIDDAVARGLARLANAGVLLLNQSVLLAGVNDDAGVLEALSRRLIECRVLPYYLHQLDPVSGAVHFEVPEDRGRALLRELRDRLPGYLIPRYVREDPGAAAKTVLL